VWTAGSEAADEAEEDISRLIAVGAVGGVYFTMSGGSKESEAAAQPSQAQPEKEKKVDREALLAELASPAVI
jgi:hypothetical protein